MTSESTLTLHSSAELLSAVPYLLGFHPDDSLVVVALRGRRVILAARHDLPPPEDRAELAVHLARVIARQGVTAATLIGYGTSAQLDGLMVLAAAALRDAGIRVLDAIRVGDGQFTSYLCDDARCCPAPVPPRDSVVAAAATYAGQVALPDRAALVAQIAPVTGAGRERMVSATVRAQQRLTDMFGDGRGFRESLARAGRRAVRDAEHRYRAGRALTDDEIAWLGLTLLELKVRDYAWQRVDTEPWRLPLWTDVLRRVESGYVPAPAVLLAWAAWRVGVGALARVAVERALAHDPEYAMARRLDELLSDGTSPAAFHDFPPVDRVDLDPVVGHVSPEADPVDEQQAPTEGAGPR
jgi:hypothetical protein